MVGFTSRASVKGNSIDGNLISNEKINAGLCLVKHINKM